MGLLDEIGAKKFRLTYLVIRLLKQLIGPSIKSLTNPHRSHCLLLPVSEEAQVIASGQNIQERLGIVDEIPGQVSVNAFFHSELRDDSQLHRSDGTCKSE